MHQREMLPPPIYGQRLRSQRISLSLLYHFRTYGTWLRGDERGSMDREHNRYGTPRIGRDPILEKATLPV